MADLANVQGATSVSIRGRSHGVSGYVHGCRCDVCRPAWAEYQAAYRSRNGRPDSDRIASQRWKERNRGANRERDRAYAASRRQAADPVAQEGQLATDPEATLCECGCGRPVNPYLDRIRELRTQRLTFREIGEALGVSSEMARRLHRFPPRFVKGHAASTYEYRTVICAGCGHPFRTCAKGQVTYCNNAHCPAQRWRVAGGRLVSDRGIERDRRMDALDKTKAVAARRIVRQERRLWTLQEHREARIQERERARIEREMRKQQERRVRLMRGDVRRLLRNGEPLPWHVQVPRGRLLSAEERLELDEILAEQARELGRDGRAWGERRAGSPSPSMALSLDAVVAGDDYRLGDSLTDLSGFTNSGELEHLMIHNGSRLMKRGLIVTAGERYEDVAA